MASRWFFLGYHNDARSNKHQNKVFIWYLNINFTVRIQVFSDVTISFGYYVLVSHRIV